MLRESEAGRQKALEATQEAWNQVDDLRAQARPGFRLEPWDELRAHVRPGLRVGTRLTISGHRCALDLGFMLEPYGRPAGTCAPRT